MSDDLIERLRGPVFGTQTALDAADAIIELRAMHGRVVEGFMEVCEAVGVQFDAPEAVAYAINTKISNAEYDKRAAETALAAKDKAISEMRAELERWQNNWDANVQEMSEKFRAVNLAQVMAGTNMDLLERLTAAEAQLERVKKALAPFLDMAGEMFARGWNAGNIVVALDNPSDPHSIDAGHFFALRAVVRALSQDEPADLGVGG